LVTPFFFLQHARMDPQIVSFKEKLEQEHTFPGAYIFKFIVPSEKVADVESLLPVGKLSLRSSSNNRYTSLTLEKIVESSEEVVDVYVTVKAVEGVISL